ncbi:7045_t:CDS:10 [Paraglomus occultum]|uniref:7045_t:CDS:1 n=1 Tax=Paraglomus occultum TaxID=144539 RepID=A0A9N8WLM0_9GLOM|nr:7045_t:CDS:10 [Paraglomus occultum]
MSKTQKVIQDAALISCGVSDGVYRIPERNSSLANLRNEDEPMVQIALTPIESLPPSPTVDKHITFEAVRLWKGEQVSRWLQENNFKEYEAVFAENDITGDVLLELDHQLLKELQIASIRDRIKLLAAIHFPRSPDYEFKMPNTPNRPSSLSSRSAASSPPGSARQPLSPRSPLSTKRSSNELTPYEMKQRFIKVISENQTKTIDLNGVTDAKAILAKILTKFNINDEAEKYSLFTTVSDTSAARSLTDDEIEEICRDSARPERDCLVLRKKHMPIRHEDHKEQLKKKKLEHFFGVKAEEFEGPIPSIAVKLKKFFGQRPPSELISNNLPEYFPGHDSEALQKSARYSTIRASRISRRSTSRSSRAYDRSSMLSTISSFTFVPTDGEDTIGTMAEISDFKSIEQPETDSSTLMDDDIEYWNSDEEGAAEPSAPTFRWMKGALIGSGSFGSVYLGLNSVTGELMAVKQVELPTGQSDKEDRKQSMLDALQREISFLKELQHENIVQYLGFQYDQNCLNIFLEYVPGGSLSTTIRNYGPLEEPLARIFVKQILQGLDYLHQRDIIHRDIKAANILVDNKGVTKISDFGISKKMEEEIMSATTAHRPSLQGSVYWMAPEVVKQTTYTTKADIWSLGCLIVEMFTGEHPFPTLHHVQAMFKIGSSCAPEIPEDITNDAKDFLRKTFDPDHTKRPSASELRNHPFVTSNVKGSPQPSP